MARLTTKERLDNLESGIVSATNKLHDVITDEETRLVSEDIRLRLNELHKRLKVLTETAKTAHNIIIEPEEK